MDEVQPGPAGNRPNPDLSQRQLEVLAAYALAPLGSVPARLLRRVDLNKATWTEWRRQPAFAAELDRINRLRTDVALEPLRGALLAISKQLAADALDPLNKASERTAAAALVLRALGALSPEVQVQNVVNPIDPGGAAAELNPAALLAKLEEMGGLLERNLEALEEEEATGPAPG